MTFRTRTGRLVIATLAAALALGLLAPGAASAQAAPAPPAAREDAIPPPHPGYEVTPLPELAEVRAAHFRALQRSAEIRHDLREEPARERVARSGRTVFVLYRTD